MNRNLVTFCLCAALAAQLAFHPAPAPGQSGAAGSGFVVRVGSGLDQGAADSMKQELVKEGFAAAEVRPAGGTYEVVIGGIASRAQAEGIVNDLKGSGFTTSVEIVSSGGGAASPATGSETVYRVQVAEFDTHDEAEGAGKALIDEGFVNADIEEANGKHVLLLNTFKNESDARNMLDDVKKTGFQFAKVVTREKLSGGAAGSAALPDLSGLSETEQAKTREALDMAEKVASGQATSEEVKQLRAQIQQLSKSQQDIISQQESARTGEQKKLQQTFPLYREFDQAIKNKNFDQAEKVLAQVRQINPNDIFLPGRVSVLERERAGGSTSQAGTSRPDPAAVQSAINAARAAEAAGNKPDAISKYQAVLALDPTNVEARGKVSELGAPSATAPAATAAASTDSGDKKNLMMYGGGALLGLIILGLLFKMLKGKKSEPVSSGTPAMGTAFSTNTDFVDPLSTPAPSTSFESSMPAASSALPDTGFASIPGLGADDEEEAPAPPPRRPAPAPVQPESESVSLDDMGVGSTPVIEPAPIPEIEEETIGIDLNEMAPAFEEVAPAAASSAMDADLEALLKGTFPGAAEPEEPANMGSEILAGAEANSVAEPRGIFEEDFNGDSAGSTPAEWRGEYDYATLSVVETDEPGHAQCLAFSKTEGVGSATYHLTFPNASGRVIAEFDLRCDEKNKFLLGVYLEKDEDFKQSIHTIIHQLDPNAPASLRVQGESSPYTMGTWTHVRYEIDLTAGTLDGYLDDNHVAKGLALASVPDYLNTISIRDNLATTGTLYLDNIRISEA